MTSDDRVKKTPPQNKRARQRRSSNPAMTYGIPSHGTGISGIRPEDTNLDKTLETLKPHDHLCLIYESKEEWRDAVIPFLAIGLKRGEKCVYVVDTSTADEIRKYLGEERIDVVKAEESGQLVILHETDAYTKEGSFDPDRMIALLISETDKAIAEGYPALRVTGEMTWVLRGHPGSEKLIEYEAKLNRDLLPHYPCLAMCQYDRWKFDPEIIKGVIVTHPILVRGNNIYRNFYYVPPEEFLGQKRAETEAQHWLNNIEREQRMWCELKESEEKYRLLAENASDVISTTDMNLRYVYISPSVIRLRGYTAEEALVQTQQETMTPASLKIALKAFQEEIAIENTKDKNLNRARTLELELTCKDGSTVWTETHNNFIRDKDGRATGIIGVTRDITERKKVEEELKRSGEIRRTVLEAAKDAIVSIDHRGTINLWNKAAQVIFGYTEEEIAGKSITTIMPERFRKDFWAGMERTRSSGASMPGRMYEVLGLRKDGSEFSVEISIASGKREEEIFYTAIVRDITERKRVEEEYRTIVRTSIDGFWLVDMQSRFLDVNDAYCQLIGYSRDELLKMSIPDIEAIEMPKETAARIAEIRKFGSDRFETRHRCKDDRIVDVEVSVNLFEGDGGRMFVFVRDITERKQAGEKIKESEEFSTSLLVNSPNPIHVINQDTSLRYVNPALETLTGFTSAELMGRKPPFPWWPEEARENYIHYFKEAMREGVDRVEQLFQKRNGERFWVEITFIPVIQKGESKYYLSNWVDITERKRAEEKLRESEEFSASLLVNSLNPMIVFNPDASLRYVNPAMENLTGFTSAELMGRKAPYPWWPEEEIENHMRRFEADMLKGARRVELFFRKKNGERFWVEVNSTSVVRDGELKYRLTNWSDITERKQAEEKLKESEEFSTSLLTNSPNPITVINPDTSLRYVNPALEKLTGFSSTELIGRKAPYPWWPEKVREKIGKDFKEVLDKGAERIEEPFQKRNGERFWVEITATSVIHSGEYKYHLSNWVDITERKRVEEELRRSSEERQRIFESVTDGIRVIDLSGTIVEANERVLKIHGFSSKEQILGKSAFELIAPHDHERVRANMRKSLEEGMTRDIEYSLLKADGSEFPGEVSASVLKDASGKPTGFITITRDITERKQSEEREKLLQEELNAVSRLATVGEMAAGIAHEINNPLTGVVGFSDLLLKKDIPEDIRKDVNIIYEGARRIASVTDRMLRFARQSKPQRTKVNINDIVDITLSMRAHEMKNTNIKVTTELAPDLPLTYADASLLQQVFLNIILNAEQAMKLAHGRGKLTVKTERVNNTILASFKDDGTGIAKENMDKIFNPFFTTREVGQGTGLGLSICHGIVMQHGGKIYARSTSGKGATFFVELPIVTKDEQLKLNEPAAGEPKSASKARILVVDDEPSVGQLITELLTEEGHEVEIVDTGSGALEGLVVRTTTLSCWMLNCLV